VTHYISDLRENSVIHPLNQAHISLDGVLQINKLSSENKDFGCEIASLLSEDNCWANAQRIEVSSGMFL
jgi:hypothetical protein